MDWINTKESLPEPNQRVIARSTFGKEMEVVFLSMSDGDYFWDNTVNEIWQSYEVSHWRLHG